MVFGANDGFKIYPTSDAKKNGLGVIQIEEDSQEEFFRNLRTGILGYTEKDIAFVQTEHPCKLLNIGVKIFDLPFSYSIDHKVLSEIVLNADLIIWCFNFGHGFS